MTYIWLRHLKHCTLQSLPAWRRGRKLARPIWLHRKFPVLRGCTPIVCCRNLFGIVRTLVRRFSVIRRCPIHLGRSRRQGKGIKLKIDGNEIVMKLSFQTIQDYKSLQQCRPSSDCSLWSSLIRVYTVCKSVCSLSDCSHGIVVRRSFFISWF